jgi:RND family efflux transporter MFP subunit
MSNSLLKSIASVVIIIAGALIAMQLASARKTPSRDERTYPGPLVETIEVELGDHPVQVYGHGTVAARVAVQVVPQVSGRVVTTHPGLVPGGHFEVDEALFTIETADFELARQRAEAAVARARVNLQLQEAEAEVARREWDRLHPGQEPPSPLVLRQPQVDQARAELASAQADLATAQLNLERTRVSLPFRGRVLSENVDIGQFVVAGQPVAEVYGTDVMEIPVPLEDRELAWFDVPDGNGRTGKAAAEVRADFAGAVHHWQGRVVRTEGEVDPATRMVQVVIEVTEPLSGGEPPVALVPGMFVEVAITGRTLHGVATAPRHAVRNGDQVWLVEDGKLLIRTVDVVHIENDLAYIGEGLDHRSRIVVSQLDVVSDGMKVRTGDQPEEPEAGS